MADISCCCKILKFVVILLNTLTTLAGIGVIVLASLGLANKDGIDFETITKSETNDAQAIDVYSVSLVVILVLGILITIIGFIGCCGAFIENQCLLGTFVFLMMVALVLDISGVVLVNKYTDEFADKYSTGVKKIFDNLAQNHKEANSFQELFHCCGAKSSKEWSSTVSPSALSVKFPKSCCKPEIINCNELLENDKYYKGCTDTVKDYLKNLITATTVFLLIVGLIEVLSMLSALFLCCGIRKGFA